MDGVREVKTEKAPALDKITLRKRQQCRILTAVFCLLGLAVVSLAVRLARTPAPGDNENLRGSAQPYQQGTANNENTESTSSTTTTTTEEASHVLSTGSTPDGTDFYHCRPPSSNTVRLDPIVLLHGASFSKEEWKASGVLEALCQVTTVVALDFSTRSDATQLHSVLDQLSTSIPKRKRITLPITLISPSASGWSFVDWLRGSLDFELLPKYFSTWIPVAVATLSQAYISDEQVKSLLTIQDELRLLAIYGNQDTGGKRLSERLGELADAKVVELPGGHPVYLHSPEAFTTTVTTFLTENE